MNSMRVTHILFSPVGIYLLENGEKKGAWIEADSYAYIADTQGQPLSISIHPVSSGAWHNNDRHTLIEIDEPYDVSGIIPD